MTEVGYFILGIVIGIFLVIYVRCLMMIGFEYWLKRKVDTTKLKKLQRVITYKASCGTVVEKLPFTIDIEEGKEVAKFNPITGKLYWPSDGSEAEGPGIRDIPNYKEL